MRSRNFLFGVCAVSIAALSLVGCQDYDNGFTEQQIQFVQGFKDVFGEIDHSNDWNLAERGSVTVTTSKPSNIKIYANTMGTYKLVGSYKDVSGTRTLSFDMVEGTTDLLVSDGQTAQKAKVGEGVIFAGTRYVYSGEGHDETECMEIDGNKVVTLGDDWEFFSYKKYVDIIVDEDNGYLPEEKPNLGNVIEDFTYISQGPFTIYPIYGVTSSCHILGVYWKNEIDGGFYKQPVYRNNGAWQSTEAWQSATNGYNARPITINLPEGTVFGFYLEVYDGHDPDSDGKYPNQYEDKLEHVVYSAKIRNKEQRGKILNDLEWEPKSDIPSLIDDGHTAWAGTFNTTVINSKGEEEELLYLGFEDWGWDGLFDLNDLIFIMKGSPYLPIPMDEGITYWTLSCEDLGGIFDIDYNDVVVKVGHTSGEETLTIEPLAAGGTLASFLYFNDGTEGAEDICLGEVHSFFGQEATTSGNYKPVNVDIDKSTPNESGEIPSDIIEKIKVAEDWSLSSFTPTTNSATDKELQKTKTMGGFYIKTVEHGKNWTQEYVDALPNEQKIQNQPVNSNENVPYIICTPYNWRRYEDGYKYEGTYRWPREHVPMLPLDESTNDEDVAAYTGIDYRGKSEYVNSFESWVKGDNKQTSIYWYRYPNVSNTVSEKEPTRTGVSFEEDDAKEEEALPPCYIKIDSYDPTVPITMTVGDELTLATTTGSNESFGENWNCFDVFFNIDNVSIVTVNVDNNGTIYMAKNITIKAEEEGEAVIQIYAYDSNGEYKKSDVIELTVKVQKPVVVEWPESGSYTYKYDGGQINTTGWGYEITIYFDDTFLALLPTATQCIITATGSAQSVYLYPSGTTFYLSSDNKLEWDLKENLSSLKETRILSIGTNNGYIDELTIEIRK